MRQWGIVAGVLSGLFWGASGLLYGELTAEFPALQTSSVLLVLLLVFETMALVASGLNLWKNSGAGFQAVTRSPFSAKSTPLAILAGVLGAPLGMFCYLLAIEQIGVGLAAPISAIYPVVGILLARFWLNEKLTRTAWFGIVLVVGCVALSAGQTEVASLALGGLVLSVLCAFCWGCEIVLSAVAMSRLTDTPNRVADYTYAFRQLGAVGGYIVLITVLPPPTYISTN